MIIKIMRSFALNIFLILLFIVVFILTDFNKPAEFYRINGGEIYLEIPKDSSVEDISEILINHGIIKSKYSLFLYHFRNQNKTFQAGY
ncbi:MAG: hypothetical protein PHV06_04190, partial [bacterium]|nr:hypothetical protein [bacterium]